MGKKSEDKSLNYRRDNRTVEEFASDIKHRTLKEKFLMDLYVKEYLFQNDTLMNRYKTIHIENNGVDNDGRLVKQSNCNADYKIIYDSPYNKRISTKKVDIKNGPVGNKLTFKTYNLTQYAKENTWILLFYNTGYIDKDPQSIDYKNMRWAFISPKNIQKMLDNNTEYIEPKFGNKPCIRIFKQEFNNYFKSHTLQHRKN